MMHTRMGAEARILSNCGPISSDQLNTIDQDRHHEWNFQMNLVKLELRDDRTGDRYVRFYFLQYMKATGGWEELDQAMQAAPIEKLSDADLVQAVRQAL